jgi:hypothetical protein
VKCAPPLPPELVPELPDWVEIGWTDASVRTRVRLTWRTLRDLVPVALSKRRAAAADWSRLLRDRDADDLPPLRRRVAWVLRCTVRALRHGTVWRRTR